MLRKLALYCLVVLLAACGAAEKKKAYDLNEAIDDYVAALRWSRGDEARSYHLTRDGERPPEDVSAMEDIRVTGYHIRKRAINQELDAASVTADIDYYQEEYGTLKHMTLHQEWWYNEELNRWFIESDFPTFE
jgi:hypothetical protein